MIFSKEHALKHYVWGDNCQGWEYIESPELSIKEERMPPGASEKLHLHKDAQQFFFILKGEASFEIEGRITRIRERESIRVLPGQIHRIRNKGPMDLEFLLVSQPSSREDRMELPEKAQV